MSIHALRNYWNRQKYGSLSSPLRIETAETQVSWYLHVFSPVCPVLSCVTNCGKDDVISQVWHWQSFHCGNIFTSFNLPYGNIFTSFSLNCKHIFTSFSLHHQLIFTSFSLHCGNIFTSFKVCTGEATNTFNKLFCHILTGFLNALQTG